MKIKVLNFDTKRSHALVKFDFVRGKGEVGAQTFSKYVNLFADVSSGTITSCLDPVDYSALRAARDFCWDADPVNAVAGNNNTDCEDNIANVIAEAKRLYCDSLPYITYDAGSKKCFPFDANRKCPNGQFLKGFGPDGELDCITPSAVAMPNPRPSPTRSPSPSGSPRPSASPTPACDDSWDIANPTIQLPSWGPAHMVETVSPCYTGPATEMMKTSLESMLAGQKCNAENGDEITWYTGSGKAWIYTCGTGRPPSPSPTPTPTGTLSPTPSPSPTSGGVWVETASNITFPEIYGECYPVGIDTCNSGPPNVIEGKPCSPVGSECEHCGKYGDYQFQCR
jgi:hypothetical protein